MSSPGLTGRPSIPETFVLSREAAAAFAGMTTECNARDRHAALIFRRTPDPSASRPILPPPLAAPRGSAAPMFALVAGGRRRPTESGGAGPAAAGMARGQPGRL